MKAKASVRAQIGVLLLARIVSAEKIHQKRSANIYTQQSSILQTW
jgi:hypothetical protein